MRRTRRCKAREQGECLSQVGRAIKKLGRHEEKKKPPSQPSPERFSSPRDTTMKKTQRRKARSLPSQGSKRERKAASKEKRKKKGAWNAPRRKRAIFFYGRLGQLQKGVALRKMLCLGEAARGEDRPSVGRGKKGRTTTTRG